MEGIRDLILKLFTDGKELDEILKSINTYAKKNFTWNEFKLILVDALGLTEKWNTKTLSQVERDALNSVFEVLEPQYALTKRGIIKSVVKAVSISLKNDETKKALRERLQSVVGRYRNYAETIARTAQNGYFNTKLDSITDDEDVFTYVGPAAERPLCKNLLALAKNGKTWTKAEIKKLDNKQGLDPFLYCGGFNCLHKWGLK